MTTVEIEYCVPCGMLDRAQDLQAAVLESLGRDVDRVALVTGAGGVFEVRVDDEVVYEKSDAYDVDAIVESVRSRAGATA